MKLPNENQFVEIFLSMLFIEMSDNNPKYQ